ncbi:ABC transporter ATP-binding protein [Desertimonas flava]|uniref:ABC transporter ATP-binding protein n=1 Tax=Desertimonas flava TaxID=2064846 RepID=UPI000E34BB36|nr:ATP-binding cassette domain-containing protein [Desertimonas flava]
MDPVLECRRLTCGYGRVAVVRDLDLTVTKGEVVAIIGPNGAGKTTLLSTIAGFARPLDGQVLLNGQPLAGGSPTAAASAGIVLVPDDRSLFTQLSVLQNLKLAQARGGRTVDDVLDLFPALRRRIRSHAGVLSGGEQQMLTLGRGLMRPGHVLLIDEMSMGLAPTVVADLLPALQRACSETDTAVLLVEQHAEVVETIADQIIVMVHGDVAYRGSAERASTDRDAIEAAYLGQR